MRGLGLVTTFVPIALEFLEKFEDCSSNFRITTSQYGKLRKFLDKDAVNTRTGEAILLSDVKPFINRRKVTEFVEHMGYYQIVTSEVGLSAREVVGKYHGLTEIEDQFRVMQGHLEMRPVFVRTPEHIDGHLVICLVALVLMRLIQAWVVSSGFARPDDELTFGGVLSAERIQEAMRRWTVTALPDGWFMFEGRGSDDLQPILKAIGIELPLRGHRRRKRRELKSKMQVFSTAFADE